MDFSDLQDMVRSYVQGRVVRTAPGQTYGPAQSIYTRTPERFIADPNSMESGRLESTPDNILTQLLAKPFGRPPSADATITVNPLSRDNTDMSSTLRHEDTHALLNGLSAESYDYLAGHNPAYPRVAKTLNALGRGGFMPQEVPAYMTETDPTDPYHIPTDLRNLYLNNMVNQLTRINPPTAAVYKRLARIK